VFSSAAMSPATASAAERPIWELSSRFSYRSVSVAWDVLGEGDPVVLLHGFPGSSYSWRTLAPALARSHRVYLADPHAERLQTLIAGSELVLIPKAGDFVVEDAPDALLEEVTAFLDPPSHGEAPMTAREPRG
jgi:pimeloyl-ACP methyl ester carboxylesterase